MIIAVIDARSAEIYGDAVRDLTWVDVQLGSLLEVECDAVVSPANSFGFMDGGLDAVLVAHFGPQIRQAVRDLIVLRHDGELLVGAADIVATGSADVPWMIIAPTMRVPMRLPTDTVNPFLAMRATLRAVERGALPDGTPARSAIQVVAVPGLGTGVGAVPAAVSARQMRAALLAGCGPIELPRTWAEASLMHQLLYTDRPQRLQH